MTFIIINIVIISICLFIAVSINKRSNDILMSGFENPENVPCVTFGFLLGICVCSFLQIGLIILKMILQ